MLMADPTLALPSLSRILRPCPLAPLCSVHRRRDYHLSRASWLHVLELSGRAPGTPLRIFFEMAPQRRLRALLTEFLCYQVGPRCASTPPTALAAPRRARAAPWSARPRLPVRTTVTAWCDLVAGLSCATTAEPSGHSWRIFGLLIELGAWVAGSVRVGARVAAARVENADLRLRTHCSRMLVTVVCVGIPDACACCECSDTYKGPRYNNVSRLRASH